MCMYRGPRVRARAADEKEIRRMNLIKLNEYIAEKEDV